MLLACAGHLAHQQALGRCRVTRAGRFVRVADRDGAQRLPVVGQVQLGAHQIGGEDRRADPAAADPAHGQRDEERLDRRPDRNGEHGVLGGRPRRIGVAVCTIGDQERDHQFGCVVQDLTPTDPAFDGVGRSAVACQVGPPLVLHRVQQPGPVGGVGQPDESHRPRVVGCGRRQRLCGRSLDDLRRDGLGTEPPNRPAQQLRLAQSFLKPERDGLFGAQPEQVLVAGAQQGAGIGAVVPQRQSAHDGDRDAGQLAFHQIRGGRDLVGDGDLGDDKLVAVNVVRPGVAVQNSEPRRADSGVDLAVAPSAPHGVGDDHADGDAEPVAKGGAQRRRASVRVDGQQRQFGGADVGTIHARRGLHDTEVVLGDQRAALACQHPDGLVIDQLAPQRIPLLGVIGCGHDAAFALGQHLAGDDDDVVVTQPRRRLGQRFGEVVTRAEFGQTGYRQQLDRRRRTVLRHGLTPARSRPARTISAVVAGSDISRGTDRTSTPAISAWSPSCTSQPSRIPTPERAP